MTSVRAKAIGILAAMLLTAAVAHWFKPSKHMSDVLGKPDLEAIFPNEFGDWRVDARAAMVLPDPATQKLLSSIYNQTLSRTYINSMGYRIMLSVAYGGDQSDATRAHLPEVCYPAQGFQITAQSSSALTLAQRVVPVRHLKAVMGNRHEPITYWLIVGDQVAASRTDQKLAQFRLGLKGLIPDGMLVRVSSIDQDMARGHRIQGVFLADFATAVPPATRDRIFGVAKVE